MVISRESDYAIRILRILADGQKHKVNELCETEIIPKQFAYKIVEKLRNAGLVRSEQGRYGGCYIDCDLHEVTLFDVLKAIDNNCYLNLCLTPGYECPWEKNHPEACNVHRKLAGLQESLNTTFQNMDMYSVMFEKE